MDDTKPLFRARFTKFLVLFAFLLAIPIAFPATTQAVTKSVGKPYRGGRLINGVPFPRQFSGYHLRATNRTYATPELIGALLDAIERVRRKYPNTCDLYLGDFSKKGGGRLRGHRSHQNGRDVDIGMYAKGNHQLNGFKPMSSANLDIPKTWYLIENLIRTNRVQYIFMDRRLQSVFYQYARRHGWGKASLDRLFKNVGTAYESAVIRHARGHRDHIHVRFYAPWSALAAITPSRDSKKLATISIAQEAYLPKKVKYFVNGDEPDIKALAKSFGVSYNDLRRWNHIRGQNSPGVGTCLVFYKRSFELEPVNLAQSLQSPNRINDHLLQLASLQQQGLVDDSDSRVQYKTETIHYRVKSGDSLYKIAKSYHLTVDKLCRLNQLSKKATLKIGQRLRVGVKKTRITPSYRSNEAAATYTVRPGDTLSQIAERQHMTTNQLCALNGIQKSSTLKSGQKLKVAASARSQTVSSASSPSIAVSSTTYTVRPGDTLSQIAERHHMTTNQLCALNGIQKSSTLKSGQKLKVAASARSQTVSSASYTVQPGDSLWSIARKHDTRVAVLCELNGITANQALHAGQKLKVAGKRAAATTDSNTSYTVRDGDNLWSISRQYKTSVKSLCAANGFSEKTLLQPGTKIKIH